MLPHPYLTQEKSTVGSSACSNGCNLMLGGLKGHLYFPVRFSARCWGPYNTYSSQWEMVYASQKEQEAKVLSMCVSLTVLCATAAYS